MEHLNQNDLPTAKALGDYSSSKAVVFHIPGHGGRAAHPLLEEYGLYPDDATSIARSSGMLLADLPSSEYVAEDPDVAGQKLAAQAWGADQAWWLLGGASQGNQAALLGLTKPGDIVVASCGSHISVLSGLVLSGATPVWVEPQQNHDWETFLPLGVEELQLALSGLEDKDQQARCVVVTSPTYFGQVADIPALAKACHNHGCALWVDGSWGSHFGFHSGLPENPLHQGADLMLASTHKHAGSLRGSAILFACETEWMTQQDHMGISRGLRWLASTSPSFLLRMGLDAARWQQTNHGQELWTGVLGLAERARARLALVPGLEISDQYMSSRDQDKTRLIIDVSASGWDAMKLERCLSKEHHIFIELATSKLLVCMVSHGNTINDVERLAQALEELLPDPQSARRLGLIPAMGAQVISPRQAAQSDVKMIPLQSAEGLVAAEAISVYPPGIPALIPGMEVTAEMIKYLSCAIELGARLYGGSDPHGHKILVVSE